MPPALVARRLEARREAARDQRCGRHAARHTSELTRRLGRRASAGPHQLLRGVGRRHTYYAAMTFVPFFIPRRSPGQIVFGALLDAAGFDGAIGQ